MKHAWIITCIIISIYTFMWNYTKNRRQSNLTFFMSYNVWEIELQHMVTLLLGEKPQRQAVALQYFSFHFALLFWLVTLCPRYAAEFRFASRNTSVTLCNTSVNLKCDGRNSFVETDGGVVSHLSHLSHYFFGCGFFLLSPNYFFSSSKVSKEVWQVWQL